MEQDVGSFEEQEMIYEELDRELDDESKIEFHDFYVDRPVIINYQLFTLKS